MDAVETGKDKVKKICEILRKETLEPALQEAEVILDEARSKAEQIIEEAKAKAKKIEAEADKEVTKQKAIFNASLNQAARQTMDRLREQIEDHLLHQGVAKLLAKSTASPHVIADLIRAVVKAIEKEGLDTDLSAAISSSVDPKAVNELLGKELLENLREKSVILGPMKGGVELKLHKDNITIDLSDAALLELVLGYVRKDFHQFFFANK